MDLDRKHPARTTLSDASPSPIAPSSRRAVAAPSLRVIPGSLARSVRLWIGPAVIALVLFELLIRGFLYSPRPKVQDAVLGRMPAPGSTWVEGTEGFGRMHWNQAGLRGRDLPADRSVPRVAVLGDSFCEAAQVGDDRTFCAVLEKELTRRLHREVWVGNCGRSGLQAGDYLYYVPLYEKRFSPQATDIAFTERDFTLVEPNVLAGGTARLEFASSASSLKLSFHPERGTSEIDRLPAPAQRPVAAVVEHSGLGIYSLFRLKQLMTGESAGEHAAPARKPRVASETQMAEFLRLLQRRATAPLVCLYIHPCNPLRDAHDHTEEQRLREATARCGIPFVGTGVAFRDLFTRTRRAGNGFHWSDRGPGIGHLNAEGHALVARAMAPAVSRLLAERSAR